MPSFKGFSDCEAIPSSEAVPVAEPSRVFGIPACSPVTRLASWDASGGAGWRGGSERRGSGWVIAVARSTSDRTTDAGQNAWARGLGVVVGGAEGASCASYPGTSSEAKAARSGEIRGDRWRHVRRSSGGGERGASAQRAANLWGSDRASQSAEGRRQGAGGIRWGCLGSLPFAQPTKGPEALGVTTPQTAKRERMLATVEGAGWTRWRQRGRRGFSRRRGLRESRERRSHIAAASGRRRGPHDVHRDVDRRYL